MDDRTLAGYIREIGRGAKTAGDLSRNDARSLYAAMRNFGETGAMTESVRKPLTGGLILLLVSVMFLFNIDWSRFWPFFLILSGGTILLTAFWPR
jgi:hypothetical protein